MSNFFNKIDAPQLTSSEYGNDLAEMVDNINANFQKVFTLPFLKGDDGDMVTTEFSYFWDSADCLTQDGASIFNAIFCKEEDPVFSQGLTHKDTQYILCDGGDSYTSVALNIFSKEENGYNSISLFDEVYAPIAKPKILMYYKIASETETKTPLGAAQLYYYFDARVGNLSKFIKDSNSNTYKENFSDYTCILSTQYNTEGDSIAYKFVKQSGWPTLYFDSSSKQFCWQINGVRTGVNAQGVSGKDGRGNKIWLCQVNPSASNENYEIGRMIKFDIVDIWSNAENGWVPYDSMKTSVGSEENFLHKGDVVIGYLKDNPTTQDKSDNEFTFDQILGVVDKEQTSDKFYVCSNLTQNTTNTFYQERLYNMCSRIGIYEDGPDSMMKGFIIPDSKTGDKTGGHALYEGTFDKVTSGLYLVHTDEIKNIRYGNGSQSIVLQNDGTPLNVYYDVNVAGATTLGDGLTVNNKLTTLNSGLRTNEIKSIDDKNDLLITTYNINNNIYIGGDKNSIRGSIYLNKKTSSRNITPAETNKYSLGDTDNIWKNVYATTFNGKLNGTIVLGKKTDNTNYPMVFASGIGNDTTGIGISLYTGETGFTYNPESNTLTVGQLKITTNTVSDLTSSGALIVSGGVGIGGNVNIGGATNLNSTLNVTDVTTLNNNLILSSKSSGGSYYSNKIIFQRNNINDNYNDWYIYGNNSGQLEIGCMQSNKEIPLITSSYSSNGTKSMEVNASVTSTVDGVQGIYTGMPVGTIIQWLDFSTTIPHGYVYWLNSSGAYRINSLFNTYLKKGSNTDKSTYSFISTEHYLETGNGNDQENKGGHTHIGNDVKQITDGFPSFIASNATFESTNGNKNYKKGTISYEYSTENEQGGSVTNKISKEIWDNLKNIPVIFQTTNIDSRSNITTSQKYYLLRNESSLLNVSDNDEHRKIQKSIFAGLFNNLGYNIVNQLKNGTAVFYFHKQTSLSPVFDDYHYGYLFYNFKDEEIKGTSKVSYDFIQIYGKELVYKSFEYKWNGEEEINTVTPIYDNKDYTVDDNTGSTYINRKFALNFQNIITNRNDIVGTHNLLKYL